MSKYALITGANRGLGYGFVEHLLSQGYIVFAGTRKKQTPPSRNSAQIHWIELDVTSDQSIEKAFREVSKQTDSLDLIVNNAGLNKDSATNDHKEQVTALPHLKREPLLRLFDANTISPLLITKAFMPLLKTEPCFVVNISSCRSSYHDEYENSNANYGYRASKIALNMMTFCSVKDLPSNIKTFAVHPGGVKTDMNPTGEDLPAEQAKKIISITEHWQERFNGEFLRYDGTFYRL